MFAEMMEFSFEDGDKLTEIFPADEIKDYRKAYSGNCYDLACELQSRLFASGIISSVLTFKNGNAFNPDGFVVKDELSGVYNTYTYHSVVMLGDCVIDMFHSDNLLSTSKYVKDLLELNDKLKVSQPMSGIWWDKNGLEFQMSVEYLVGLG